MKFSSAAFTVAAISLLSSTHAAPLAFKDGEITGRLHHRRSSDISGISEFSSASQADEALEDLNIGFEPASHLILPRILNFIKRQVTSGAAIATSGPQINGEATNTPGALPETPNTGLHTTLMTPDYESYGFASESGPASALVPVRD